MRVRIGTAVVVGLLLVVGTPLIAGAAPTPSAWCGPGESATDLPDAVASYQLHVIYAIASDGPDNFATRVTPIVRDLAIGDSWWQSQDPTRTPRFDLASFPGCDSTFGNLDISSVRLPGTAADYEALGPQDALTQVRTSLAGTFTDTHKKYVVYLDTPVGTDKCGIALSGLNFSAYAGATAVVFLQPTGTRNCLVSGLGTGAYPAMVFFHEFIHSLQPSPPTTGPGPPHLCDGNHVCDDPQDIMASGGVNPARLSAKLLDSGHDDYYAHSGTWFDVRNSLWLSHLDGATVALTVSMTSGGHVTGDLPGVVCSTACTTAWDAGTTFGVQAVPDSGYGFAGWLGGCSGQITLCSVTMKTDVNISAHFARTGSLPVEVVGHGTVDSCAKHCSEPMLEGNEMTLRATPAKGARFVGWEGSCRGKKRACTFIASQGAAVRAVFSSD